MMIFKNLSTLLLVLSLSACFANGELYSEMPQKSYDKKMARVTVFRPSGFLYSGVAPTIEFGDVKTCDLPQGSFLQQIVKPEKIKISAPFTFEIGNSSIMLDAKAGGDYYIMVSVDSERAGFSMAGGLIGSAVSEAISNHSGSFVMQIIDKKIAEQQLKKLRKSC